MLSNALDYTGIGHVLSVARSVASARTTNQSPLPLRSLVSRDLRKLFQVMRDHTNTRPHRSDLLPLFVTANTLRANNDFLARDQARPRRPRNHDESLPIVERRLCASSSSVRI